MQMEQVEQRSWQHGHALPQQEKTISEYSNALQEVTQIY